jgi:hypothetical protein
MIVKDDAYLERRFQRFLRDLSKVAGMRPRTEYLYPVMRGVPFQDFHTALHMAIEKHRRALNDNDRNAER